MSAEVTQLLSALAAGQVDAADRLLPLIYQELRRLAGAQMARLPPDRPSSPLRWSTKHGA